LTLRTCLYPLNFYKNWFLAIVHKNFVFKKLGVVFGDQFLKIINQLLLSSF
jgi:hypothetical protein